MDTSPFNRLWIEPTDTQNVFAARQKLMAPSRTGATAAVAFSGSTCARRVVRSNQPLARETEKGQKWGDCLVNARNSAVLGFPVALLKLNEA